MRYIVFDMEWNQPDASLNNFISEPFPFDSEIIEIGAVKLDESFHPIDELCLYIAPQFYPVLNTRITQLTGITSGKLKNAPSFPQAYETFLAWCGAGGEDFAFMTWGPTDAPVLMDNMMMHGMATAMFPDCYDLQRIFGHEVLRDDRQCSLEKASEILNIRGDRAHDALHDAQNTAKICDWLDLADYLPEYRKTYILYSEDRLAAAADTALLPDSYAIEGRDELMRFACPWCGTEAVCEKPLRLDCGKLITRALCGEEDEFFVTFRWSRFSANSVRVRRKIREMSDDDWDRWQNAGGVPADVLPEESEEETEYGAG